MRATRLQGWYYLGGGLWPLLHFRSFEAVAGRKPDRFQTEVTSILFAAAGATLLAGTRGGRLPPAVRVLALSSALGTAYADLRHRRRLRAIFRAEAALELLFATSAALDIVHSSSAGRTRTS